ncbi:putative Ca2+-binding hemolysin [Novosphingobium resinovorum]|uniref:Putative Ca2+-binding hemolysin n=1 Tax=Novosphingobium resinovorum TaxID=158500 RepID=A0A031J5E9_9SPHN|nr:hypothetical protein [Novosphingobium resinovorum]EZP68507.1 putative Ca2+-binding hemolysin [Novosphingobium resinovorum]
MNETGHSLEDTGNVVTATSDYLLADGTSRDLADVSLSYDPVADSEEEASASDTDVPLNQGETPANSPSEPATNNQGGGVSNSAGDADPAGEPEEGQSSSNVIPSEEPEQTTQPSGVATPIVLDFDNDEKSLVALADSLTRFDMNGDGVADRAGWIEADDAFLALDRNSNGEIDDIKEISFVSDKQGAKTDLEGLAAFDTNANGLLDSGDVNLTGPQRDTSGDRATVTLRLISSSTVLRCMGKSGLATMCKNRVKISAEASVTHADSSVDAVPLVAQVEREGRVLWQHCSLYGDCYAGSRDRTASAGPRTLTSCVLPVGAVSRYRPLPTGFR